MRGVQDTETGMPRGAQCAFKDLMSHSSAIRITYRISLRSSSLQEPRYPLLKVVISLLVLANRGVCTPSALEFSLTTRVGVFGVLVCGSERDCYVSLSLASPRALAGPGKGGESCLAARPDGPLAPRGH